VGANPEPNNGILAKTAERAMVRAHPDTPDSGKFLLKPQRRVSMIAFPKLVILASKPLDFDRKIRPAFKKPGAEL
jgi:hypothetical protein